MIARIGLFVTGAAAAATLVFTVFAMRRDQQSRIALTVMALPILVCGVFVDPFLAGFILASIVLLWTRPASDWFAGRAPRVPQAVPPMPTLPTLPRLPDRTPAEPPAFGTGFGRPSDAAAPTPPPAPSSAGRSPTPPTAGPPHVRSARSRWWSPAWSPGSPAP